MKSNPALEALQKNIASAYEADDVLAAMRSLTEAFQKRRAEKRSATQPNIEPICDSIPLEELIRNQGSKVVEDWRKLAVAIAPEGETAEEFLRETSPTPRLDVE